MKLAHKHYEPFQVEKEVEKWLMASIPGRVRDLSCLVFSTCPSSKLQGAQV